MNDVRAHLTVYGCQMNRLDAELVAERLRRSGARMVDHPADANVLLFLTCSVRAHAEDRLFSNIGALAARKRREPGLLIGILGCTAQQYGEALCRKAPQVDVVCGPGRLADLPDLIASARAGRPAVAIDAPRTEAGTGGFRAGDRALDDLEVARPPGGPSPGHAYVTVIRGCDNFCAYCVVPRVRGPERSRAPAVVLDEIRRLVDAGARRVTLLGQAVNKYDAQEGGRRWDLADLLAAAAETPGLARLEFITNHPRHVTERLADVFRDVPAVAPYLHMPAQAGSETVLARMKRGYTAAEYADRVAMVRRARPDVAVASDFIVGFPGETEADFDATCDLVRRLRFSGAFVFKYSPRPGTYAAAHFEDDVPVREKRRRHQVLLDLVQGIALEDNKALVGQTFPVFVEGPSPRPHLDAEADVPASASSRSCGPVGLDSRAERGPGGTGRPGYTRAGAGDCLQLRARTPHNRIVVFDGPADLAGRIVPVRIVRASALTLFGELVAADIPAGG